MKYKCFAKFFVVVFTASVLLQPGNAVFVAQAQDAGIAVTEGTQAVEVGLAEEAESLEASSEESAEQPEVGCTEPHENSDTEEPLPEKTEFISGENREASMEERTELLYDENRKAFSAKNGIFLPVDGLDTAVDGNGMESGIEEFSTRLEIEENPFPSVSSSPLPSHIAQEYRTAIASGSYENVEWVIDENGKLTVSGTGEYTGKAPWDLERSPWYEYCETIKSAEINLTDIKNASYMFYGCINLTSVDVNGLDTSEVDDIGGMFFGCSNLQSVDVSHFNTSKVTQMNGMFSRCSNLVSVDVSHFDTGNVIGMWDMFYECSSLTSLDVSHFDTQNVTNMQGMFEGCQNLTSLDLSSFDMGKVQSKEMMLNRCDKLVEINTPYNVTRSIPLPTVENTVWRLSDNTEVTELPQGLDHSVILTRHNTDQVEEEVLPTAMQFAPYDVVLSSNEGQKSYVLAEGSLPGGLVLTEEGRVDGIPRECGVFSFTLHISDDIDSSIENAKYTLEVVQKTDNYIASGSYENIIWYIDASGKLTVNGTGDYADSSWMDSRSPWYEYREQVISAEINVTGMTNARDMFFDCYNLASVDVSNFDTSTVTNMRGMFERCSSLTSVDVSNFNTERVTDMALMFCGCSSLEDVDPSKFNSGQLENMYGMFWGCSSLTSLDISFDVRHVKNMATIVAQCNNLLTINTPYYVNSGIVLLPHVDNTVWRLPDGTEVIEFPRGLDHSVTLTRHDRDQGGEIGIPVGAAEFNGHYYYLFDLDFIKNADDAISYCEGRNGYLATITSDEENNFLFDYMKSRGYGDSYFGFSDRDIEGTWKWLNGEETSYTNWHDGEPNAENPSENYAMFFSPNTDGTWNDGDFTSITTFICEWEIYNRDVTTLSRAVKFTPYESILSDGDNQNIVLASGTLPSGLSLTSDGHLSGVPTESGSFSFAVQITNTDGSSREAAYVLSVNENTDNNFSIYADPGYELTELVPNLYFESIPDEGSQLMVSNGSFEEFTALYLDGEKLTEGIDYTAESGSTRITIQNQTLKRKGAGSHTLAMEFRKGDTGALKWAAQNYVIAEGADPAIGGDNNNPGNGNTTGNHTGNGGTTDNNSGNNNTAGSNDTDQSSSTTVAAEGTSSTIAYKVQLGENLSKIAQRFYGSSRYWHRVYTENAGTIRNPNRIYPGQVLIITLNQDNNAASEVGTSKENASNTALNGSYTVISGDNLYKIAQKVYGLGGRWNEIYQANKNSIANPGRIYAGQILIIP